MDLEDFNTACKIPQWGNFSEPRKSEYKEFLASITMGETRDIAQAKLQTILNQYISMQQKDRKRKARH